MYWLWLLCGEGLQPAFHCATAYTIYLTCCSRKRLLLSIEVFSSMKKPVGSQAMVSASDLQALPSADTDAKPNGDEDVSLDAVAPGDGSENAEPKATAKAKVKAKAKVLGKGKAKANQSPGVTSPAPKVPKAKPKTTSQSLKRPAAAPNTTSSAAPKTQGQGQSKVCEGNDTRMAKEKARATRS